MIDTFLLLENEPVLVLLFFLLKLSLVSESGGGLSERSVVMKRLLVSYYS